MKHQMMFLSAETEKAPFNIEGGFFISEIWALSG